MTYIYDSMASECFTCPRTWFNTRFYFSKMYYVPPYFTFPYGLLICEDAYGLKKSQLLTKNVSIGQHFFGSAMRR